MQALAIEPDFLIHLNYAASTYNASQAYQKMAAAGGAAGAASSESAAKFLSRSKEQFSRFCERWKALSAEAKEADEDTVKAAKTLASALELPFD